ncbi:unnamed protein product [Owenia fusiformis]|uniref:Uncharacterized protein n=1 Tax=Owenia fusiformis TaxID=6347 RepID=A0A8J1U8X8_OWEFU|nr:unnamed protein product [Owenia fusiformis]
METIVGEWVGVSIEGLKELMDAMNLSAEFQEKAAKDTAGGKATIRKDGDSWIIGTGNAKGMKEHKFQLNSEYDYKTSDGREAKVTVTEQGPKVVETQKHPSLDTIVTYEIVDGNLVLSITECKTNVTAKVTYKKA